MVKGKTPLNIACLLVASVALASEVPFTVQEVQQGRDVSSLNENFRSLSDGVRQAPKKKGDNTLTGDNTFSGNTTLSGSTTQSGDLTVTGRTQLSSTTVIGPVTFTASVTAQVGVLMPGNQVTFTPALHNSSFTVVPTGTFTNTTFGPCVSTVTMTTSGGDLLAIFSGMIAIATSNTFYLSMLLDGAFLSGHSATVGITGEGISSANEYANAGFSYHISGVSAGSHSLCLQVRLTGGTGTIDGTSTQAKFGAIELK